MQRHSTIGLLGLLVFKCDAFGLGKTDVNSVSSSPTFGFSELIWHLKMGSVA